MTSEERLAEIAARLDRLQYVPTDVLASIVTAHGKCMLTPVDPDTLTDGATSDEELAMRYCAGCPIQDECLEWELRLSGPDTVGIWGSLSEDDRRALYPLWRARGERVDGGESP